MRHSIPTFRNGDLELRCGEGEIIVYGTPNGLRRLAKLCNALSDLGKDKENEHIHLEDYELLTTESFRGTIAVIRSR